MTNPFYAKAIEFIKTHDLNALEPGKHVLDGDKKRQAARDALRLLVEMIDKGLENGRYVGKPFSEKFPLLKMQKLSEVDPAHYKALIADVEGLSNG